MDGYTTRECHCEYEYPRTRQATTSPFLWEVNVGNISIVSWTNEVGRKYIKPWGWWRRNRAYF